MQSIINDALKNAELAVIYTSLTIDAFIIVYCWIPKYLVTMRTMVFLKHSSIA